MDPVPDKFNNAIKAFLAVFITLGFFTVIGVLLWIKELAPSIKDILLVMLGALLASWKEVTGYFFGSSSGSTAKDAVIANQAAGGTGTGSGTQLPPGTVTTTTTTTEKDPP